jgi:hypothetical protein
MKDPDEQPEDDFKEALGRLSPEDLKRTLEETYLEMHAHALLGEGTPLRFHRERSALFRIVCRRDGSARSRCNEGSAWLLARSAARLFRTASPANGSPWMK